MYSTSTFFDSQIEQWLDLIYTNNYDDTINFEHCDYCRSEIDVLNSDIYDTPMDKTKVFCCESCRNNWNKENVHDYSSFSL